MTFVVDWAGVENRLSSIYRCVCLMAVPVENLKSRELSHLMVEVNALGNLDEVSVTLRTATATRQTMS